MAYGATIQISFINRI